MALGEEKTEVEASTDTKTLSCGRWSCGEHEGDSSRPVSAEQPPRVEAEGGPASPVWGAECPAAPACCPSGPCQVQASSSSTEPVAGASQPALSCLLSPAGARTGDLHFVESQVATKMEDTTLSASEELPQTVTVPRATVLCSGHDADTEDGSSPVDSPRVLDVSQQPHISRFPFSSKWRSVVSPGATVPQFSSCSASASYPGSSLQRHQKKAEPQHCSLAKVSSSLELVSPQSARSVMGPGRQLQWSPQPACSGGDAPGLGRRRLSFQAEYWACVLPDSLPPSPDRHSPLWNPNKEYEDLLDYTYPLRPRHRLPKHLSSHTLADPVLQDSGVDLDSFSISPASTLKSPTNVSHSCPPVEATALPISRSREPSLKRWHSGLPHEQGNRRLASCSQLSSTPRAAGSKDTPWEGREPAPRHTKDCWPRTWDTGWPSSRPEREKGASQGFQYPACIESGWKPEELESDDEYLALPTRLTQVSSLVSYLDSVPALVTMPARAAEGQSSLDVSDSDGPTSFPSDCSRSQLPSGAALRSGGLEGQSHYFLGPFMHARDSAGDSSLVSGHTLGLPAPLRTRSSPVILDQQAFLDPDLEGHPPSTREQGKESLVHCVKTFCCQLEELIRWLYNVADVTDHLTPPKSSLTGLKSSLQLYRQFKKDIDEHQSLTEKVLEKGEILLQCLLDNTPGEMLEALQSATAASSKSREPHSLVRSASPTRAPAALDSMLPAPHVITAPAVTPHDSHKVLKDVLGRISKQPSELESHADHLYDTILASVDMLAGCSLIPDNTPMAHRSADGTGISLASSQAEM